MTGHSWKREIAIERFGPVSDSAWCDQMPAGAMSVSRHRDVRSHKQVPDGEDCHTRKVDNGNGTFSEHRECTPKTREEPVYDERCTFSVDRWAKERTVTATGASMTDAPRWPSTNITRTGSCVGCEREGARSETYTVTLVDEKGGTDSCDVDPQKWTTLGDGTTWKGAVRLVGGLDCSSLTH